MRGLALDGEEYLGDAKCSVADGGIRLHQVRFYRSRRITAKSEEPEPSEVIQYLAHPEGSQIGHNDGGEGACPF